LVLSGTDDHYRRDLSRLHDGVVDAEIRQKAGGFGEIAEIEAAETLSGGLRRRAWEDI
jgi:hypothetical protein